MIVDVRAPLLPQTDLLTSSHQLTVSLSIADPPPWLVEPLDVRTQNGVLIACPPVLANRLGTVADAAVRATAIVAADIAAHLRQVAR